MKDKSLFYQDLSFEQGKSYFIYGDYNWLIKPNL